MDTLTRWLASPYRPFKVLDDISVAQMHRRMEISRGFQGQIAVCNGSRNFRGTQLRHSLFTSDVRKITGKIFRDFLVNFLTVNYVRNMNYF